MYDFPGDVQCIEAFFVILPLPRRVASDVATHVILLNLLNNPFLDKIYIQFLSLNFCAQKKKNQTIFFLFRSRSTMQSLRAESNQNQNRQLFQNPTSLYYSKCKQPKSKKKHHNEMTTKIYSTLPV